VGEDEVSESSLLADITEHHFILRVDLNPQADSKNEASNRRDKSRKERIKGEGPHQTAVHELDNPGKKNVAQISVNHLQLLWRLDFILVEELFDDAYDGSHYCGFKF